MSAAAHAAGARQTAGQVLTAIVDFDELLLAFKAIADAIGHAGTIARRRRLRLASLSYNIEE
jgi:hypothetical protein